VLFPAQPQQQTLQQQGGRAEGAGAGHTAGVDAAAEQPAAEAAERSPEAIAAAAAAADAAQSAEPGQEQQQQHHQQQHATAGPLGAAGAAAAADAAHAQQEAAAAELPAAGQAGLDPLVAANVAAVEAAVRDDAAEQKLRTFLLSQGPLDRAHKLLGLLVVAAEHTSNIHLLANLLKHAAPQIAARVQVRAVGC
jgi:hypothetical protein